MKINLNDINYSENYREFFQVKSEHLHFKCMVKDYRSCLIFTCTQDVNPGDKHPNSFTMEHKPNECELVTYRSSLKYQDRNIHIIKTQRNYPDEK